MGCTSSAGMNWAATSRDQMELAHFLTERQIQVIRDTWDVIGEDVDATGVLIFKRIFDNDKELKALFKRLAIAHSPIPESPSASPVLCPRIPGELDRNDPENRLIIKHSHVVMEALGATVECLDDSVFLSNVLVALGQIHATYDVRPQYLSRLWPHLCYGLKHVLQEAFTVEVEEAWRLVFNYIITKMREGIRQERQNEGGVLLYSPVQDDTQW